MMQPMVISGAVENPNSSAPSSAATAMSLPVRICPSACRVARPRRSLATRVWCVSASPSSHGRPANQETPLFTANERNADTKIKPCLPLKTDALQWAWPVNLLGRERLEDQQERTSHKERKSMQQNTTDSRTEQADLLT